MEFPKKEEKRGVGTVGVYPKSVSLNVEADPQKNRGGHFFVIEKNRFPILMGLKSGDRVVVTWVTTITGERVTSVEKAPS